MNDAEAALERIDALSESGEPLGVLTRREVHEQGVWHRTFQCWYVRVEEGDVRLLIQRRHPAKQSNPNKYDVTVAGHLLAGEDVTAGVRECYEEMGIPVQFSELNPVGAFRHQHCFGRMFDREICHVFVHRTMHRLSDFKPALDEVTGLYELRATDLMDLLAHPDRNIRVHGYAYDPIRESDSVTLTLGDLVDRPMVYYDTLLERCTQLFL